VRGDRFGYGYWPDLDGLRGVAVLAVIAAHAHVPYMAGGGFAGVTAFFVLSGFLITRLLAAEHATTGRVDLRAFYIRRGLRLLPALLLIVAASAVVYGLTGRIAQIVTAGPAVLLYAANWVTAFHGPISPFQHTWSLAVEEQFYMLWPVTFLALSAWAARGRRLPLWQIVAVAAIGFALWRALVWGLTENYDRANYGFDTNAFGLLVGCALGLRPDAERAPRPRSLLMLASLAGLGVIGVAIILPHLLDLDRFGVLMYLPLTAIVGASIVVAARGSGLPLLANPVVVAIGRISYGLYLWHWVVPRMAAPWLPETGLLREVVSVGATFVIATLSFVLLERPALRLKTRWAHRTGERSGEAVSGAAAGLPPAAPLASGESPG
jgi:peptidoglycan/LPS O-acetylase OafA/YrhL